MKRSFEKMDSTENDTLIENASQAPKKPRDIEVESTAIELMDYTDKPSTSIDDIPFFKNLHGSGHPSLVEREPNPGGYTLVNPKYVGKTTYQELINLETSFENAVNSTEANARNKIEMIGQQIKYLQETLCTVMNQAKRDSELHSAACNFVKSSGNIYHLYERHTGQKYFSMLSPQDWDGSPPHKFLGSWYLEADQSWTPADDVHLRYQGLQFLRKMYMNSKSLQ